MTPFRLSTIWKKDIVKKPVSSFLLAPSFNILCLFKSCGQVLVKVCYFSTLSWEKPSYQDNPSPSDLISVKINLSHMIEYIFNSKVWHPLTLCFVLLAKSNNNIQGLPSRQFTWDFNHSQPSFSCKNPNLMLSYWLKAISMLNCDWIIKTTAYKSLPLVHLMFLFWWTSNIKPGDTAENFKKKYYLSSCHYSCKHVIIFILFFETP